jgi:hypothetical protein
MAGQPPHGRTMFVQALAAKLGITTGQSPGHRVPTAPGLVQRRHLCGPGHHGRLPAAPRPLAVRRLVTMVPAFALIAAGADPVRLTILAAIVVTAAVIGLNGVLLWLAVTA